jgi:putative ABC transport system permease protein
VAYWDRADAHFPDAERIYVLTQSFAMRNGTFARSNLTGTPLSAAAALAAEFPAATIARAGPLGAELSVASGGRAVRVFAAAADPEFLDLFPLPFAAGDARTALGAPRSAVLTRAAAARLFGTDDPLGKPLLVANTIEATVTGVIDAIPEPSHMGDSATAPLRFDVLLTMDVETALREATSGSEFARVLEQNWSGGFVTTYLELPPTLAAADVERQLPGFVTRRVPESERASTDMTFGLLPLRGFLRKSVDDELFSGDVGASVSSILLALGALVLGIACVNYANLAIARAARRLREVGVRKALGAGRAQIGLQHLIEAAALTAVALTLAIALLAVVLPALENASGMRLRAVLLGGGDVWLFVAAVFATATLLAGVYPALAMARVAAIAALRPSFAQLGAKRLAAVLVGAQFAAASLLVIAVTVTSLQNAKLVRTGLGAVSDPLLLVENPTQTTKLDSATLHAELARLPGVTGVTEAANMPWQRLVAISFVSASAEATTERSRVLVRTVGRDFFEVLGIELLAGRAFDPNRDTIPPGPRGSAPPPGIVDRAFVEQFGLGSPAEAVGRLVYFPGPAGGAGRPTEIVGVVENRRLTFRGAGAEAVMYGFSENLGVSYVRLAAADVGRALDGIDAVWSRLAPNVAINRRFFDEEFNRAYETFLRLSQVFRALSLMALAIATAGLVGMATLIARRRRREIGVRKTFGASTAQMVAMLLAAFSRPVVIANAIVWPIAYFAARAYLRAFLDPISLSPLPFLLALIVTLAIAWLAVGAQTVQAARLKPADVLRNE